MLGAWSSGRLAGRIPHGRQIGLGWCVMLAATALNLGCTAAGLLHPLAAMLPVGLYAFGWALAVPVVTLILLDLVPERRGMASSVQAFLGSAANAIVAGVVVPLVMRDPMALALASAALMAMGLIAWLGVRRHLPARLL